MLSGLFVYSANTFVNRFANVPYVAGAFKSIGTSSIHPAEAALMAALSCFRRIEKYASKRLHLQG